MLSDSFVLTFFAVSYADTIASFVPIFDLVTNVVLVKRVVF